MKRLTLVVVAVFVVCFLVTSGTTPRAHAAGADTSQPQVKVPAWFHLPPGYHVLFVMNAPNTSAELA